ncbi:BIG2, partial [Symbiodinium natans]
MLTYVLPCPSQRQGPDRRIHRIHRQIRRFYRLQADNAWQKRCRPVCKPVRSSSHELQLPTCDRDVCLKCSTFSHYHAQVAALLAEAPSEGLPPEEAPQTSRGARDGLLLESLCDLLQPSLVQAIWFSFDGDWRRPPLLEQIAGKA